MSFVTFSWKSIWMRFQLYKKTHFSSLMSKPRQSNGKRQCFSTKNWQWIETAIYPSQTCSSATLFNTARYTIPNNISLSNSEGKELFDSLWEHTTGDNNNGRAYNKDNMNFSLIINNQIGLFDIFQTLWFLSNSRGVVLTCDWSLPTTIMLLSHMR